MSRMHLLRGKLMSNAMSAGERKEINLPRLYKEFANRKIMVPICSLILSILLFCLSRISDTRAVYCSTFLGPTLLGAFYLLHPINPYSGFYAEIEGKKNLHNSDLDASRLVAILKSSGSKLFLVRLWLFVVALLSGIMFLIRLIFSSPEPWGNPSLLTFAGTILSALICNMIFVHAMIHWACQKWKNAEA
jgi:hypothetical protein